MAIKKETWEKLAYTLLIYASIFILFGIAAYLYTVLNAKPDVRFTLDVVENGMLWSSVYLLAGGIGISGEAGFAGFPFMSFFVINGIIYFFVKLF